MPEIIDDGVTGFVVKDIEHAVQAVARLPELSRERCRQRFEERFTATRMAGDYLKLYQRLIRAQRLPGAKFGRASTFAPRLRATRTKPPYREAA